MYHKLSKDDLKALCAQQKAAIDMYEQEVEFLVEQNKDLKETVTSLRARIQGQDEFDLQALYDT